MTWEQVCARRLARHGLVRPFATVAEAAGTVCGMHAQVLSAAELGLGLRTSGLTSTDVRAALWTERTLVKTCGPRGTLHLLPAADLPFWCSALGAAAALQPVRRDQPSLDRTQLEAVVEAIDIALADGELTAEELEERLVELVGPWAGERTMPAWGGMWPRWQWAVDAAAYRGLLCFGPPRGRTVTYTSPRGWLPAFDGPGRATLDDLALRYLSAYGPATADQFAQWLAAPAASVRSLFDRLAERLEKVEIDGRRAFLPDGDADVPIEAAEGLLLLPYFDPYVVGCHPRDLLFPGVAASRAKSGGQPGTVAVLLVDGTVGGIWHQRRSGRRVHLTVEPFAPLSPSQLDRLDAEVDRIGRIREARPALTLGEVTARGHL